MIITSIILIIISVTGIILIHEHDTQFFSRTRITTTILPAQYQHRLDSMRAAQGTTINFKNDANSVPLSWLMYDLHSGEFFGNWAWIYYDLISIALIVYSISGIYLFIGLMKPKLKTKES